MSAPPSASADPIGAAVAALGPGPLTEPALVRHLHPLFSRVLANGDIYLANHSLGRPPDRTAVDVGAAMDLWYTRLGDAWEDWLTMRERYRADLARLLNAPRADCIVPRTSAGAGLRTILNCFDTPIGVVSTRGEFASVDHVLKTYDHRGRIRLTLVDPDARGEYSAADLADAIDDGTGLVVVSLVFYLTAQWLTGLASLIAAAHARGALVLVDVYHAAGILPVDLTALDADFAIGGCYKYLRGGPGAAWLYLHPRHLDGRLTTLDSGWFAQTDPLAFASRETPALAPGGDAFLEATPTVLPFYQARAGLELTLALGVQRLRAYSLRQQALLAGGLAAQGVPVAGEAQRRGAFLAIPHPRAAELAGRLKAAGIVTDARAGYLRLCPDILNTEAELAAAAARIGSEFRNF